MSGRITQKLTLGTLVAKYGAREHPELDLTPRFNGCPGQDFVVVRTEGSERRLAELRWGRIPEWAANQPGARQLINARSETVHAKTAFRAAFRERRCVVPVNGWFEWRPENGEKQPYWIRPEGVDVFSLAGIWEPGSGTPGSIGTFVILTTAAAPTIADIHHRQPHILDDDAAGEWLRPGPAPVDAVTRAKKDCGSLYDRWPVSALVNSPRNDSPALLMPRQ
ncbi:MAG: SOS response-associated peptidase [Immundisolibacterales bacterium]|nr:SOS response-associated peptidase [Immundisolibacterales bacterium]